MPNMTIKDIARLSGCSVSTISRVINDRPDVRPETKEKVLQMCGSRASCRTPTPGS